MTVAVIQLDVTPFCRPAVEGGRSLVMVAVSPPVGSLRLRHYALPDVLLFRSAGEGERSSVMVAANVPKVYL